MSLQGCRKQAGTWRVGAPCAGTRPLLASSRHAARAGLRPDAPSGRSRGTLVGPFLVDTAQASRAGTDDTGLGASRTLPLHLFTTIDVEKRSPGGATVKAYFKILQDLMLQWSQPLASDALGTLSCEAVQGAGTLLGSLCRCSG